MQTRLEDVRKMIAETDKDNSGSVDFEEFLQASPHTTWQQSNTTTAAGGSYAATVCGVAHSLHMHVMLTLLQCSNQPR